jgi:hypothetical protein
MQFTADTILNLEGTVSGDLMAASGSMCDQLDILGKDITVTAIPVSGNFTFKTPIHANALRVIPSGSSANLAFDADNLINGEVSTFTLSGSATAANITWGVPAADTRYAVKVNGTTFNDYTSSSSREISFAYDQTLSSPRTFTLELSVGGAAFVSPVKPDVSDVDIFSSESGEVILDGVPQDIYQIAISSTPDFADVSWQDFDPIKSQTIGKTNETLYIKFRTDKGAVSDVIVYAPETTEAQTIKDGDIIQCKNSDDPFAVYIVKVINGKKFIRHIVSLEIFNFYSHLKWENLIQISSLDGYALSGWVRVNTGSNGKAGPNDKVWEINADQTRHHIDMTAEEFLLHGGSEDAIYSINRGELDLYEEGPAVKLM